MSVAVTHKRQVVHATGYGYANVEHLVPATEATVYQIASVAKQFTAGLLLLLENEASLSLSDAITVHLPEVGDRWKAVKIAHLLTHTAGISEATYEALNYRLDYSDEELLREIGAAPQEFAPGERWSYCNAGYVLLGLLIGRVTGQFYGDLLQQRILQPLGMATARVNSEEDVIPNRAAGYCPAAGGIRNQEYVSPSLNRLADGGLSMSVLDLAKWDLGLSEQTLFNAEDLKRMWTPVKLSDGSEAPYGFGWSIRMSEDGRLVEHSGGWQGFSTHIARYLDRDVTSIVLCNLASSPADEIAHQIARQYMDT